MEWLILLFLVPAILVPVVLLCGFAGCSFEHGLVPDPPSPPAVTATPKNVDHITVSWQNTETDEVLKYRFVRTGGTLTPRVEEFLASTTTVEDTGLEAGTEYTYEVSTITQNGSSDPPGTAKATTWAFSAELAENQPGLEGFCLVQRIQPPLGGIHGQVRITVRGSTAGALRLDKISISQPAASGDPWDSAADPTHVASSVDVPPNMAITLPLIPYPFDGDLPLLIAFDISATAGLGNVRSVLLPGSEHYFRATTQQAWVQDRFPDPLNPLLTYSTGLGRHYLVERIEVA